MLGFFVIIIMSIFAFSIFGGGTEATYSNATNKYSCPMCGKVYSSSEDSDICYNDCCAFDDELNEI